MKGLKKISRIVPITEIGFSFYKTVIIFASIKTVIIFHKEKVLVMLRWEIEFPKKRSKRYENH
jgi:hypothetical protein